MGLWFGLLIASTVGLAYQATTLHAGSLEPLHTAKVITTEIESPTPSIQAVLAPPASVASSSQAATMDIPIMLYHDMPTDFEAQLQYLQSHHYTTVTMAAVYAALTSGAALPSKPAVITFDDGLSDQMNAFALLEKYQMKATFYIITGGEASKWCIGADRRYDQGYSCGDQYLNWDQIRQLDASGLIEIGAHTVDHLDLAKQSELVQRFQIEQSKATIESHLGHSVSSFAYPYGSYTQVTVGLVAKAGFSTAATTRASSTQSGSAILEVPRLRSTLKLP